MRLVLDSSVVSLFLKRKADLKENEIPLRPAIDRLLHRKLDMEFFLPAPAMAEVLNLAGRELPELLTSLQQSFKIMTFDYRCAIEASKVARAAWGIPHPGVAHHCLKVDFEIIACALAYKNHVDAFCSLDSGQLKALTRVAPDFKTGMPQDFVSSDGLDGLPLFTKQPPLPDAASPESEEGADL